MQLIALKDQVIIRPVLRVEEMRGGIILPDVEKERVQRGIVVAVGPRCVELRTGDEVLYEWYGSVAFAHDGERLLRFAEADILAVVTVPGVRINAVLPAITKDRERVVRT